jgi:hypothetical protein
MENNNNTQEFDKWELALIKEKDNLKECQTSQGLNSCIPCEKIFNCDIRKTYVKAVYESMNKGSGGGFEF